MLNVKVKKFDQARVNAAVLLAIVGPKGFFIIILLVDLFAGVWVYLLVGHGYQKMISLLEDAFWGMRAKLKCSISTSLAIFILLGRL